MWEALIKFILGINFMDGIIAVVLTFVAFFLNWVPNYDHLPFKENNHYIVLVALFAVSILLIRFVRFLISLAKQISTNDIQSKADLEKAIRKTQEKIDSLDATELQFVVNLLNQENRVFYTYKIEDPYSFFNSHLIARFECVDKAVLKEFKKKDIYHIQGMDVSKIIGYQLEEVFYSMLKCSIKKYGKISVSGREKELLEIKESD